MNSAGATFTQDVGVDVESARRRDSVSRITSAFLKTLSLNAPRNCVPKKGAKRRSRKRPNWLVVLVRFCVLEEAPCLED